MQVTTLEGNGVRLTGSELEQFSDRLQGALLRRGEPGYDTAREVWNAMIDRHPALIVQCEDTDDVIEAVGFARERDLLVSVKAGGHSIAGNAVCEDGLMIDLSQMKSIKVNPEAQTARAEPGVVLGEFDQKTQAVGLATPLGYNSTTGIAGLTLGGGFGWLSRKHGMTVDNLRAVDIVTADGQLRHASQSENEDLFWAVRGGSGNFGVVTNFEYDLHEVGPEVLAGLLIHPLDDASDVLRAYREFAADAPDEAVAWCVFRPAPPLEFIPEEWHGEKIFIIAAFYAGDMAAGEEVLRPLREIGTPIADVISPHSYVEWQQVFDPLLEPGARNYWKSHNFVEITDGMIETFVEYAASMPTALSEIAIAQLGGAINRVPVDATAYPHRDAEFLMNLHTRWEDPAMDEECIEWARECYKAMTPHATGGVYVNFVPEEPGEERAAYGENYDRLVKLKRKYDPTNFFRRNHNIGPKAA